jgi:hypothetical protein
VLFGVGERVRPAGADELGSGRGGGGSPEPIEIGPDSGEPIEIGPNSGEPIEIGGGRSTRSSG